MSKILILSDSFNGYGAEKMLVWVGRKLISFGHKVSFCAICDSIRNEKLNLATPFYNLGLDRKYNLRYYMTAVFTVVNLYKKNKFDYIITFHTNPYLVALLGKVCCGYKLVHSERDNPYNRDTVLSKFKMSLYQFANKVVFQTEGAKNYFGSWTNKRSVIIPNPIEIPTESWSYENSNKTIVCVGRLNIRYKCQDLLLCAFTKVLEQIKDYNLLFYGDGNDYERLVTMAKEKHIESNVIFTGKIDNVEKHLISDGIFVLASDSEGIPNALMEAMALGMPVISTDCEPGGARVLIDSNKNGIIIPRRDPDAMAEALLFLINNPEQQIQIGKAARESMRRFSPNIIGSQWNSIFE